MVKAQSPEVDFIVRCRDSVRQEESFISFVRSVTFPVQRCLVVSHVMHSSQFLVPKDRTNGQHNKANT